MFLLFVCSCSSASHLLLNPDLPMHSPGMWTPHQWPAAGNRSEASQMLAGLCMNMEQKLWAVAFILAELKTPLDVFHGETKGVGPWRGTLLILHQ